MSRLGDRVGYSTPSLRIPSFSLSGDRAVLSDQQECGRGLHTELLGNGARRVAEGQDFIGVRPEEPSGVVT